MNLCIAVPYEDQESHLADYLKNANRHVLVVKKLFNKKMR